MKKLPLSSLDILFSQISEIESLYIPADDRAGRAAFTPWRKGLSLTSQVNTVRSAKDLFFPQVEELVKFRRAGKQIQFVEMEDKALPFVVFGVRACDYRSFGILDKVFLAEPADTFYAARRQQGTVITLACGKMQETCFCTAFGIDPSEPGGDVTCWMDEKNLYWQANTEKGAALTGQLSILDDSTEDAVLAIRDTIRSRAKMLPLGALALDGFDREHMLEIFNSKKWASLSESCLGCGTCTFVCPTCQCYDVEEFNAGAEVCRFRCWDSCMYSDFTQMSAGQPRPTQLERFRQRFMHKLVYFPTNNDGVFGCVGCGRCLQKCPIHMNIVKVAKTLKEDRK